jgi:hypothetical protein
VRHRVHTDARGRHPGAGVVSPVYTMPAGSHAEAVDMSRGPSCMPGYSLGGGIPHERKLHVFSGTPCNERHTISRQTWKATERAIAGRLIEGG